MASESQIDTYVRYLVLVLRSVLMYGKYGSTQTCEFGTSRCRCHGVDWHGVPVVSPGSVEDLAILLARFY